MFGSCYEISINVIAKHKPQVRFIWPFCLPGEGFLIFLSGEKNAGLRFALGNLHPGWHYMFANEIRSHVRYGHPN